MFLTLVLVAIGTADRLYEYMVDMDTTKTDLSEKAGLLSSHADPTLNNDAADVDPPQRTPPSATVLDKLLYIPLVL